MTDMAGGLEVAREFIPRAARRALYAAASIVGYLLSAAVVGFTVADVPVPTPLTVALAVLGALLGPIGQLAASNVAPPTQPPAELEVLGPAPSGPTIEERRTP